jgi:hypothetical protein
LLLLLFWLLLSPLAWQRLALVSAKEMPPVKPLKGLLANPKQKVRFGVRCC